MLFNFKKKRGTIFGRNCIAEKSISCTIFAMLLIQLLSPISFAASKSTFKDVTGDEYYAKSAEFLSQKGILSGYEDGSFGADRTITRAEMATIVCRALGKELISKGEVGFGKFDDVLKTHWAFGYINIANDLGIVSGDGNGSFRPEDSIKYEEAIKMILCTMGFDNGILKDTSDWSKPYIDRAAQYKITENLKGKKGQASTRGDVAVMLYNSLTNDKNLKIFVGNPIELKESDDVYALARILEGTHKEDDLLRFNIPQSHKISGKEIEYLQNASYTLTSNIALTFDSSSFLGIGTKGRPFKGEFHGNGKTISLSAKTTLNPTRNSVGLFSETADAKIIDTNIEVKGDIIVVSGFGSETSIGALVGNAETTSFENCKISFENADFGAKFDNNKTIKNLAYIGGTAGKSKLSVYKNCTVNMKDSCIIATAGDVESSATYAMFSVGGLIGFSNPGSDNTSHIGRLGNQIYNCKLTSDNTSQKDIISACVNSGKELTAGGLVGATFNNILIKDSSVQITNGNIVAYKSGSDDSASTFGTQAGGIIGRLEHTGEVSGCSVLGNSLNIISKSPNNESNAGGIVGQDLGPYHRDIVTVNNCTLNGSGNSNIILEITTSSDISKRACAGGILGSGNYKIENCSVSGVAIKNMAEGNKNAYAGSIAGYFSKGYLANLREYFTPQESGIFDCTASDVTFDTSSNVTIDKFKSN